MDITINSKDLYLKALNTLAVLLKSPIEMDIAILRSGVLKGPVDYGSRNENTELLTSNLPLSTAEDWGVFDWKGEYYPDKAAIAGIRFNPDDLKNIKRFVPASKQNKLSAKDKLVVDATIYHIASELTSLELELAEETPQIKELKDTNKIMQTAFSGLDLSLINRDKEKLLKDVNDKIKAFNSPRLANIKVTAHIDKEIYNRTKKANEELSPPDYMEHRDYIKKVEEERREKVSTEREKELPALEEIINEGEIILGKKEVDRKELLAMAEKIKSAYQEKNDVFGPENEKIQTIYADLVLKALYQAAKHGNASLEEVLKEVNLNHQHPISRHTIFDISEHIETLGKATAKAIAIDSFSTNDVQTLIAASRIGLALSSAPSLDQKFKDSLIEAREGLINAVDQETKAKIFLDEIKEEIIITTTKQGWDTFRSRYHINLDGKEYTVPKRIFDQYNEIQKYENQPDKGSAYVVAEKIYKIANEKSSAIFGPSTSTKEHFDNFKEKYKNMCKDEGEQPAQEFNKPSST